MAILPRQPCYAHAAEHKEGYRADFDEVLNFSSKKPAGKLDLPRENPYDGRMFTLGVLASTNGTNLQAILDEIQTGKLPGVQIKVVISDQEKAGALEKAKKAGIKAIWVNPKSKTSETFEKELIETLGEVDLVCLIGFMRILGPTFIQAFEGKILNVHPSLLPKFGGKGMYGDRVHQVVLEAGDKESGMTIHLVTPEVDAGPIVLQKKCAISPNETVESLKQKVQALEKEAYPEAIRILKKKSEKAYLIEHDRPNCIGCTACANIAPRFWTMSPLDGKSDVIGSEKTPEGHEILEISEEDFARNLDAAEACPVNVIHLTQIGSGKRIL